MAVPVVGGWNDFSKHFRTDLHFVGFENRFTPIPMRLMFADAPLTSAKVKEVLGNRANIEMAAVEEPFISVLSDTASYRILVKRLGFDDAFDSLERMHDVVVTTLQSTDEQTLELAKSDDFIQGALREDKTFAASREGSRYLTRTAPPDVADAAHSFNATVHLHGMDGEHVLNADFGHDFPLSRRALVLVGENGVGKTRFLRSMIEGLQDIQSSVDGSLPDRSTFDPRPTFSRLLMFSSATSDPYPPRLPPWDGLDYRFHRMTGRPPEADDDLAQSLLDCMRLEGEDEALKDYRRLELLDAILEPLGIKESLYVSVGHSKDTHDLLPVPVRIDDNLYLPFFRSYSELRQLQLQARMNLNVAPRVLIKNQAARNLSSGEQALLRFAVQAIGSLRSGTMFLFDEPETHLHPTYVSIFMTMLDRLLELSGSVALIATHSAYIVREVPSRRVRIVRRGEAGEIAIQQPRMQTFGASIDTISQFVFGDLMPKHRFQEVLDQWLNDTPDPTVDKFRDQFRKDLNAETLSYLAQTLADRQAR